VGIDELEGAATLTPAEAAERVMPTLAVTGEEARDLRHGKRLVGQRDRLTASEVAALDPDGTLVGILEARGRDIKSAMNMPEVQA
jgi:tRNA pseudouridine55 synthase